MFNSAREMYILAILCLAFATVSAQIPEAGKCPDVKVMQDFQPDKYWGKWFEIAKFPSRFENDTKCNRAWYNPKPDGHFWVFNLGLDQQDHEKNATGDAYIPDPSQKAKIQVKFKSDAPYAPYWVLDTDYDNYSLVYSCVDIPGVSGTRHLNFAWVLGRTATLEREVKQKLYNIVDSFGIGSKNFKDEQQTHCYSLDSSFEFNVNN